MGKVKILPVKSDIVFRMFFADERNADILKNFLKSVLKLPDDDFSDIFIADPYLLPDYISDKYAIIDIKLRTKSNKIIHVEIQLKVTPETRDRIVFYDAKLITEQLGSGGKYETIQKVISIVITEEKLIKQSSNYHHRFTFYDPQAEIEFSDIIEIHTIELKKLPKNADGTELYDWARFIAAESEEELNMVAERNPKIQKAVVTLQKLSADEQARDMYERREKAMRDIDSRERFARAEGKAEGIKSIVKNALLQGYSIESIQIFTGLEKDTILKIQASEI